MKLEGKTALVTGASRGIGRSIAIELAKQGLKRLFLVARNRKKLAEVAAEIEVFGVEVVPLAIDLTDSAAVNIAIAQAWRDRGPIHLLVNCAGVAHQASFLRSPLSLIQEELALNLMGTYTITRIIARRMAAQQEGTIVNVSSLMGKFAAPTMATYSATKFAILGFTQALRSELAPYNIHVTALLPTLTDTDMVRDFKTFRWVVPMTAEKVAQALIIGLQKDSPEILVGWQSHLAVCCHRFAPWLMELVLKIATPELEPQPNPNEKLREALAASR
ncbi:3-ketoacyl-ACP reductase [Oscillatoriales cyanobacterium USR001]|nr:3-ketoacyl-ACP reductase [Oscillatoriales cyanobacterium USR001]